jgi:type IV pilus assembly protein PilN
MARINLLPWREERRKQREREFYVILGASFAAAALVSFLVVMYFDGQIEGQKARNQYLTQQIAEMDKKLTEVQDLEKTRAKLLQRKQAIEELQANRSMMVHLFDDLVRTIPDGVRLTSIKQDEDTLMLEGRAQSNARVSTYMRNLEGSGWMTKPDLSIIEAKGEDKALPNQFKLTVKLANPNAPKDEDGDGVPDAPAAAPAGAAPTTTPAAPANPVPAAPVKQGAAS